jgi:hypothetical protein
MWALGCVLFELSALKPAFNAFNMPGLVKKVTTGPTPQVGERDGERERREKEAKGRERGRDRR